MSDNDGSGWSPDALSSLQQDICSFKSSMTLLFNDCSPTGIGTLKFHLLDHIVDDLRCFGSIRMLTASPFEHFNIHIKSAHASTSGRLLSRDAETAAALTFNLNTRILAETPSTTRSTSSIASASSTRLGLVTSGTKIPLYHFIDVHHYRHGSDEPFLLSVKKALPTDAFKQLRQMLSDEVQSITAPNLPLRASLTIVQSGYIDGGFDPTLEDCKDVDGLHVLKTKRSFTKRRQRVFGISWDRPYQSTKQSFVAIKGLEKDHLDVFWIGQVLLLFHLDDTSITTEPKKQFAFVQFMEVTKCLTTVDEALGCVCLRWATEDNIDHTVDPSTHIRAGQIETAEWYGLVPFDSIVGTVQVLRSNIPIPPFTSQIPWPLHRFHINRFYVNKDQVLE
jgi:hypothetical protein